MSRNLGWGAWTDYDELVALRRHQLPSEHSATTFSWARTASAVVCAKMLRMVATAISPEPFAITAKTSRTK
ncbi:hypothetical protein OK006_9418 [Actinobacteria bacterium OK006]|nr:hypothetical protein OK006_9418 [Actinobacteria bacterium OK006]